MSDGQGQGTENLQGQGTENLQGQGQGQGQGQSSTDDLTFRYSDATPMNEFFRDYPQYAENPNFTKYKTVKAFAEGHEALVAKLGTSVNIPGEDATEDQLNEFYNKLGRPETSDKYEFEDNLPEGLAIDTDLDKNYRDLAYSIGLTQKQAQELRGFYNEAVKAAYEKNNQEVQTRLAEAHAKNVEAIKEMWKQDYKAKTQIAVNTAKKVLSQSTLDYLDQTGLGNNVDFVRDFYELSKKLSSGKFVDGPGDPPKEATLEELDSEAMKILRTPNWQNDPKLKQRYDEITLQRADMRDALN